MFECVCVCVCVCVCTYECVCRCVYASSPLLTSATDVLEDLCTSEDHPLAVRTALKGCHHAFNHTHIAQPFAVALCTGARGRTSTLTGCMGSARGELHSGLQTGTKPDSMCLHVSPEMAMLQSADSPACCTDTVLCLRMAERTRRQPLPLSTSEQRSSTGGKGGVGGKGGKGGGKGDMLFILDKVIEQYCTIHTEVRVEEGVQMQKWP